MLVKVYIFQPMPVYDLYVLSRILAKVMTKKYFPFFFKLIANEFINVQTSVYLYTFPRTRKNEWVQCSTVAL